MLPDGVLYSFEIVGGPYDGAPGLCWFDDGEHDTPDEIWIGRCPGDQSCGQERCGRRRQRAHVAYWTCAEGDETPVRTIRYEKEEESVQRIENPESVVIDFVGRTRYAMGGLDFLGRARQRELVPVGAGVDEPEFVLDGAHG